MMNLDRRLLMKLVKYDPDNGDFVRVAKLSFQHKIIKCVEFRPKSITPYGYLQINILGRPYPIHRLIFLYMKGRLPKRDVDHKNGNRLDNRWCNLREVSRGTNLKNIGLRTTNTTGHIGVHLRKDTNKYHSYINHRGKKHSLGDYETFAAAVKARRAAEIKFGFHRNHGRRKAWNKNQN